MEVVVQKPVTQKALPVRPKRADSGTAIDLTEIPLDERPLGFREILAVKSFTERMEMYQRARQYWANANHGLDEWVGATTAPRRPIF